ncbi:nickel-responsive transcriptional regulator NikR [Acetobacter sp.]|jgi:CopG family nickel-responsive transcriptional regulator|uniref:nickel-responsive transcriptional regulator NikR n=1 Tax=Acetobacter sp. TaxID=440 RepID=UPI0025BE0ECC|nr:nickel-responsive transcriptional regulator NikR [Acetobacter sp.]MCH4090601.1 nickel-responsive transcriptional regulator NikR [Acetobacter sp.]MCI1300044.1 nickel-responsive transcriptional regulator NikR [Acetobacter sp.]MCI1316462.1 nickel-responsive transcriptional regulator NikR [Acetobacter sp.]
MERITITIGADLLKIVDTVMERRGYTSRSEAVRDMIRDVASREEALSEDGACVAVLDYVYDHKTRELAQRLTEQLHDHHDLSVASMHVHLDREHCLETTVLRGPTSALRQLSDTITTQRGVHNAHLHVIQLPVKK